MPLLKICMRSVANRSDAASGADMVRIRSVLYFSSRKKEPQQTAEGKNEEHHLFVRVKVLFADSLYTERAVFCTGKNFLVKLGEQVFQQIHPKLISVAAKLNKRTSFFAFHKRKARIF